MGFVGTRARRDRGKDWWKHCGPRVVTHARGRIGRGIGRGDHRGRFVSGPGALGLPHHTNAMFSFLALGVGPPHLPQCTDAEVDVLRGANAVIR
jgi:hypothetical protein